MMLVFELQFSVLLREHTDQVLFCSRRCEESAAMLCRQPRTAQPEVLCLGPVIKPVAPHTLSRCTRPMHWTPLYTDAQWLLV